MPLMTLEFTLLGEDRYDYRSRIRIVADFYTLTFPFVNFVRFIKFIFA